MNLATNEEPAEAESLSAEFVSLTISSEEWLLLDRLLVEFELKTGERKTPPKGWTYADVLTALRVSTGIREKLS